MQFFSLYAAFQLYPCLGNLLITAIIFSLEEGELGKKRHIRIGVISDFVKGKLCHWCEWKTNPPREEFMCCWQFSGQERMERSTHLSPVLAAIPAAPGLLLCSSLRHRHQGQDQPTWKPAFGRWHWRTSTWLLLMSSPNHENKGFMGESTPQTIALALGTPGLGWQQCPAPSLCAGRCA